MSVVTVVPDGCRKNARGHFVPVKAIHALDLLRDDTVLNIVDRARYIQQRMAWFKKETLEDILTFCAISAEQYGWAWGGSRGNVSLLSFDGRFKVALAVADTLAFDERVHVAKGLIDECIHEWSADSGTEIRTLIEHAFQVDKEGNINTGRVFSLMQVKIDHPKWLQAMLALKDSIKITATSQYLRVYERVGESDKFKQLALDMAGL